MHKKFLSIVKQECRFFNILRFDDYENQGFISCKWLLVEIGLYYPYLIHLKSEKKPK